MEHIAFEVVLLVRQDALELGEAVAPLHDESLALPAGAAGIPADPVVPGIHMQSAQLAILLTCRSVFKT